MAASTHNDFAMRVEGLDGEGCSCNHPSTPHRDHTRVYVGHLLHNLETHGALTRQDVRVVIPEAYREVYIQSTAVRMCILMHFLSLLE